MKIWWTNSRWSRQRGHSELLSCSSTFLSTRLSIVGRRYLSALQIRSFALFGTFNIHSNLKLSTGSSTPPNWDNIEYADFVVYYLVGPSNQTHWSSPDFWICTPSKVRWSCCINWVSHTNGSLLHLASQVHTSSLHNSIIPDRYSVQMRTPEPSPLKRYPTSQIGE